MRSLVLLLYLYSLQVYASQTPIRLLNWWGFFPREVSQNLKGKGFEVQPIEYKSNAIAFSKLASGVEPYDVVVVSNNILEKITELQLLETLPVTSRGTFKFLKTFEGCEPLSWATTTFIVSKEILVPIRTLQGFLNIKQEKALIDDPLEVLYRYSEDNEIPFSELTKNLPEKLTIKNDFKSDIKSFFKGGGKAAYGWHGEAAEILDKHNLRYDLPKGKPIIGADYVCLLKKRNRQITKKRYLDFIRTLTNPENARLLSQKTQYFSPYISHTNLLDEKNEKLKKDILKKILTSSYLFITAPDGKEIKKINDWWRTIRYEN